MIGAHVPRLVRGSYNHFHISVAINIVVCRFGLAEALDLVGYLVVLSVQRRLKAIANNRSNVLFRVFYFEYCFKYTLLYKFLRIPKILDLLSFGINLQKVCNNARYDKGKGQFCYKKKNHFFAKR